MESNIKGLVAAGHEMASELKAECGAVDMRSVAKLISDLATQLEVQLVRANALAAENAGMKSNGRELLSEACKVYEKFNATISSDSGDFIDGQTLHEFQFVLDVETPATDAFLAEVRAQERTDFIGRIEWIIRNECNPDKTETILNELQSFSDQLRKGGNQ
ncbi:TPA: hypothetical protein KEU48_001877 [Escherichia coli]|nr:hypothetical protein [Escherichia coli]HBC5320844.1 hypothetical protein [Escherichia coli]HBJ1108314.1 hypothetical protein [Escherichia coli]